MTELVDDLLYLCLVPGGESSSDDIFESVKIFGISYFTVTGMADYRVWKRCKVKVTCVFDTGKV